MFGHNQDDNKNDDQKVSAAPANPGLLGIDDDNEPINNTASAMTSSNPSIPGTPNLGDDNSSIGSVQQDDGNIASNDTPQSPNITPPTYSSAGTSPVNNTSQFNDPIINDDLVNIKKQALQELNPLIEHLDQSSEEKFKTTMMMIQTSDDKSLIPRAFTIAKSLTDEKQRAQALLDIVNEINYFTHKAED